MLADQYRFSLDPRLNVPHSVCKKRITVLTFRSTRIVPNQMRKIFFLNLHCPDAIFNLFRYLQLVMSSSPDSFDRYQFNGPD